VSLLSELLILLASYLGDSYPFPGTKSPHPEVFCRGKVEFEEWSMLTLTQRLAAGAMGLPFFPTRSLAGSSLADNLADFTLTEDPFTGEPVRPGESAKS